MKNAFAARPLTRGDSFPAEDGPSKRPRVPRVSLKQHKAVRWCAIIALFLTVYFLVFSPLLAGRRPKIRRHSNSAAAPYTRPNIKTAPYYFTDHVRKDTYEDTSGTWLSNYWRNVPDAMENGFHQCLTYEERYSLYQEPLSEDLQIPIRGSKTVFIIRAQPDHFLPRPNKDFVRYIRSVIVEVEVVIGLDVVILIDVNRRIYANDSWLQTVPQEFQSRVTTITHDVMVEYFPGIISNEGVGFWNHSNIVMNYYLDMHKEYDFWWALEADARLLGGSWPQFFNNMNHSLENQKTVYDPQLVYFVGIYEEPHDHYAYAECSSVFGPLERFFTINIHVYGIGRRLNDKMVALLRQGKSCWDENFIITSAIQLQEYHALVHIPVYRSLSDHWQTTWSFRVSLAQNFYRDWKNQRKLCRQGPVLVHPYKFWLDETAEDGQS